MADFQMDLTNEHVMFSMVTAHEHELIINIIVTHKND